MHSGIGGMYKTLPFNCVFAEMNIDFAPRMEMSKFLAIEKQGCEPVVAPGKGTLLNSELTQTLTQTIMQSVHGNRTMIMIRDT
jgi:hypothetical protein